MHESSSKSPSVQSQPGVRPSPSRARPPRRALLLFALLSILILVLAACGRDEEEPTPTAAPAAESPLVVTTAPTDAPDAPDSPLPSPTAATPQEPDTQADSVATATVNANGTTAVFTPLEVDEGIQCDIESHIDLAGYPDLEQVVGCPTGEATTDPIAINEFGEGPDFDRFMLWFSDTDQNLRPLARWNVAGPRRHVGRRRPDVLLQSTGRGGRLAAPAPPRLWQAMVQRS